MQNYSQATAATPLDIALSYNALGWPVFPCRAADEETDDFDAETGEVIVLREKTPYTTRGFRDATKFERNVREFWVRYPTAMVGVPTGKATGVFVLDLDIKPGIGDGHEWLTVMEDVHGELPDTARAKTMGGGTHIFFRHVDGVRNRGGLGKCVDIRGDGGYVIAPGSRAIDGRTYEWLEGYGPEHIGDAPQWLLELLLPKPVNDNGYTYSHTPGGNKPYVEAAMQAELNKLASTGPGGRGSQLNASAYALGQFVGAGELRREEAEDGLWEAAQSCGVSKKDGERETRAKIKRGLDAGMRSPRAIPAQSASHFAEVDNTTLRSINNMIARGKERAAQRDKPAEATEQAADHEEPPQAADNQESGGDAKAGVDVFVATPFVLGDPADIPTREFLFGTHYIRKFLSVTVAPGGLGKTSNSIAEALSMVSGKRILRESTAKPLRVWLFNAEDPREEMQRRIVAACSHYNLTQADLDGRLFVDSGRDQELIVVHEDRKTGLRINEPIVDAVANQIERNRIDVMIVDPFVSTHRVNENDNGAVDTVAKLWAQVADVTNIGVDVVHHLRKLADREATVEDSRGAVSLIGAARSVRVLNRMSVEQSIAAGVPASDRYSYFAITNGKVNLTKMDMSQDWRRLHSVGVGNGKLAQGSLEAKPQDFAGVVVKFKWPDAAATLETLTDDEKELIKVTVDNAQYKDGPRAKNHVHKAIAYGLRVDLDDEQGKARVAAVYKAMLKEGALVRVEEVDKIRREKQTFIRSDRYTTAPDE